LAHCSSRSSPRANAESALYLSRTLLKRHSVLPGFDLALGFTLLYLGLIVLMPLSAAFLKTFTMTWPAFWDAVTSRRVVASYRLTFGASLAAAVILNARTIKWRPVWRVMFFAPYVTTLVATAVLWNYLLHTRYGVINWALTSVGLPAVDWLGNPDTSIPAILIFVVWKIFGYNMLIFLAVLQTVPDDLYEAARIDGAGPWARFTNVTLPAIAPTLLLVSIISVAGFFQLFAEPYVMTQGGPAQSTVTVLYFMYEEGFKWWNLGSASAVAFILFLCIFAVTLVQLAVSRRLGGDHT